MITIRECAGAAEEQFFWQKLQEYFVRDLFPDPEDEDRAYFLGEDYEESFWRLHARRWDKLRFCLFAREGVDIGFVMSTTYQTEDDRCFLMEFCVFPEYRGGGTGRQCARLFEKWAFEQGAKYIELNASTEQRRRFWRSVGYRDNGRDDWGERMLTLPPKEKVEFTGSMLRNEEDWQLCKLANGLLCEQGKEPLSDGQRDALAYELASGRMTARVVHRGYRMIGIRFMDENGNAMGEYVEPIFRNQGAEELLRR